MDSLTVLAQQKPVTLMYHSGAEIAVIDGNPESLQRAFVNVIENAIKYTPAGNTVIVSTALYDNNVVISIVDSGIGI